ncbi:MAG: 50S ribosomal L9 C-terminal domain-containing protein [Planctomycetota bacterium]
MEALKSEHGAELDPAAVVLDEPIRELGVFDVKLRLAAEIDSAIKVWVVQEG